MTYMNNVLERFYSWQERMATLRTLVVMLAIYPIFPALILPHVFQGTGLAPLDITFGYSASDVYQLFEQLGASLRKRYFWGELSVDFIYSIYYATLASLILAYLLSRRFPPNTRLQHWRLFPYLVMLVDWTENIHITTMLQLHPAKVEWLAMSSNIVTLTKWAMVFFMVGLVLYHWGRYLLENRRDNQQG